MVDERMPISAYMCLSTKNRWEGTVDTKFAASIDVPASLDSLPTVRFKAGIVRADVKFRRNGNDLGLAWKSRCWRDGDINGLNERRRLTA
jgi:hypothetical protein